MKKEKQLLKKLYNWFVEAEQSADSIFIKLFYTFELNQDIDFDEGVEVDAWLEAQFLSQEYELSEKDEAYFDKRLIAIATTGEGGEYFLWNYKGIKSNLKPIVYLGGNGEYEMVAASLPDFINRILNGEVFSTFCFDPENNDSKLWRDCDYYMEEMKNSFELASSDQAKEIYLAEIRRMKEYFSGLPFIGDENQNYDKNIADSPSFKNFIDRFLIKKAVKKLGIKSVEDLEAELCREIDPSLLSDT